MSAQIPPPGRPDIERLDRRTVYENRWMSVHEDRIRRSDGSEGIYGVIDKVDFVLVVPVEAGRVTLVEQYRYPVGERRWELVQGTWETRPDADMAEVARGELVEETGLEADSWERAGEIDLAPGLTAQTGTVFVARDLRPGPARVDAEEIDLLTASFAIDEVDAMIADGVIRDAPSVAAWHLARARLA